jgi:hypothetical protein
VARLGVVFERTPDGVGEAEPANEGAALAGLVAASSAERIGPGIEPDHELGFRVSHAADAAAGACPFASGSDPELLLSTEVTSSAIGSGHRAVLMELPPVETLLERREAMAAIDAVIESAGRSEGSVLVVEGSAGLGKTAHRIARRRIRCRRARLGRWLARRCTVSTG